MVKTTDRLEAIGFSFILFENLFKSRQLYLQPQTSVLSNLRLAA
ncbi:DNA alkylation repair enzyme [Streptococcus pneumoniae GA47388]|nr:DNA alkylation repair enzyme [Streptococcus pneumoniae GA47388]